MPAVAVCASYAIGALAVRLWKPNKNAKPKPANKSVPAIPFAKLMQQCLSLLCAVAGDGCHAGRDRHLVVGNGLTRNGLPLYQHS